MNYTSNNLKNVLHGFFLAIALGVAEPSTTLPLIIAHFSSDVMIVGFYTSLLRGGAIVVQLFAAFYAQSFKLVMPYLRLVFLVRFLSWLSIGLAIYIIGDAHPKLTLFFIALFLFIFSFSAGFGSIYFNEILAKVFTQETRGKSMANRQFFAAIGSILSGIAAGYILEHFPAPKSYAYLFIVSAFLMAFGLIAFASIKEPVKEQVLEKEKSFWEFLGNAAKILRSDKALQIQIITVLLSYSFLFSFAYVILQAKQFIELSGWLVGGFIVIQMSGAMVGNIIWKKIAPHYKQIMLTSFILAIISFTVLLFSHHKYAYFFVFFTLGMAIDGFRIATINLLFSIAPQDKRPIYIALQNNITSLGLFFAIPGGFILKTFNYTTLYSFTIFMLSLGLFFAMRLKNMQNGI
ncbi:MFS transporter [Nitratiruptor tergarcus]|uniref:Major Facilitator Superfamily protein n=1 Tax=Nitratiruptor tergarcus DSM 16512 TaxID=1069081 RepID=A0A1W1WU85_9BACT|nr:MFS transporter [Nitratiruptor tergarcus]SMC09884.1 Major Facilitator Superfamily protein [Nitratiruptor tergarcus DSM 16512]